jgi:DNA polymerase I
MDMLVLIDVENVSYRNFHAMPRNEFPRPATFGLLRDIGLFKRTLHTLCGGEMTLCFCFDCEEGSLRKEVLPSYKQNRMLSEERTLVREEIRMLRRDILPRIGYRNIFHHPGAEADDMIAAVVKSYPKVRCLIITTDHDLYQLIDEHAWYYNVVKKQRIAEEYVEERNFGVGPSLWVEYKSLTGCKTNNIPGIPRVGAKTGAMILQGTAKEKIMKLLEEHTHTVERNRNLIRLPYHALNLPARMTVQKDQPNHRTWDKLCRELDMKFLIGKCPG